MNQCVNGHENTEAAAFCSTCGSPLTTGATPTGRAATPAETAPGLTTEWSGEQYPTSGSPQRHVAVPAPAEQVPRSKRNLLIAGGVGALVLVLAGVVFSLTGDDSGGARNGKMLRGIATLVDEPGDVEGSWEECEGAGGYSDFTAGMRLSVKGQNDEIVGSGDVVNITERNIDDAVQAELDGSPLGLDGTDAESVEEELRDLLTLSEGIGCMLYFEADIESSEFYSVELASRGDLSFSKEDLAKQGYVVGISLGNS